MCIDCISVNYINMVVNSCLQEWLSDDKGKETESTKGYHMDEKEMIRQPLSQLGGLILIHLY